jgi:ribosomal protein S18 acetylase RimI-like enzyme
VDVTIRPARADDYAAYTRLFAELEIPDPIASAEKFAQVLVPLMQMACAPDGAVVGFVSWRTYGTLVHVMQVAVDREIRGQRVGQRLLEHVRGAARAAGCERWYLNVKRDNAPALRLYERCGFRFELEAVATRLLWANVPQLATRGSLVAAGEDAGVSTRYQLPLERLTMFRARPTTRMVALRDVAGSIIGFAPFDVVFSGCAAFCADRPELAASLLAEMRTQADLQGDFVRVTIEGNRSLADAVMGLGAELIFEILRLSADL